MEMVAPRFGHAMRPFVDPQTASELIALDKLHVWHPFTPMQQWNDASHEPLLITKAEGVWLTDQHERRYIDGNSSIWTNIHGHRHPTINAAISRQLGELEHSSFLGFTNEPAIRLAAKLTGLFPPETLSKVFFSDNGSTAMECALKMAVQYWQIQGKPEKCEFLAFENAYHGDTLGAATLGGIASFHGRFQHLGFRVHHVRNADALFEIPDDIISRIAGIAIEPLIQGAAGMKTWPKGMLNSLRKWCDWEGVLLLCDEVMTGFGRTGTMFASEQEEVTPDFLALSKGITGGYLPLGATLTTQRIFDAFLGRVEEMKTFYYGHSYCGNPLACAAALASLQVFEDEQTLIAMQPKIQLMESLLTELKTRHLKHVPEFRQVGLIAGIDLMKDVEAEQHFDWRNSTGVKVCEAARKHGLLTRPVRDTVVLMPPLSINEAELRMAVNAISEAIGEVLGSGS